MTHHVRIALLSAFLTATCATDAALAQSPQNPSPMVEHTRPHAKPDAPPPSGVRETLSPGVTLFIPQSLAAHKSAPLLIFFHGGAAAPERAAAENHVAVISVQAGSGSGTYAKAFPDGAALGQLLTAAAGRTKLRLEPVMLGGWSAGCGAIRSLMRDPVVRSKVHRILLVDGIHAGYANGKPGPLESALVESDLDIWVQLAQEAVRGKMRMIVTHSEIFPGTFASTTETADYLLRELKVPRHAILRWGPMGTQQLSEAKQGQFHLLGYAGNSAPDHVDQLNALPVYVKWLAAPLRGAH